MPRYAFRIEYHGAPFSGWQRQSDRPSVQGALEEAISRIEPGMPVVAGAGRTDAGVHATAQVAQVDLSRPWAPFRLSEALNHHLKPLPVAITACAEVPDDWHARFTAIRRSYLYRIANRRAPPVHERGLAWHVRQPLDADAMHEAAQVLVGRHDFTTFRSTMCQARSPVKTLDRIEVSAQEMPGGTEIRVAVEARSFLHNQVRSFVGSLERVGAGTWTRDDLAAALQAKARSACGPVAPPQGLYLTDVGYPTDPFSTA